MSEREKILIVEDEAIVAKDLQQQLINLGYKVPTYVLTGEDAIKQVKKIQPELILMDVKLDGKLDGIQVGETLKDTFDIPIIFLTAYGDTSIIERAKMIEPNGYIMKPFNIQEVHSNIQMALHKNKMESKLKHHHRWVIRILQSMGDAVITTDLDQKITFMNLSAEQLTGYSQGEAIENDINSIINIVHYQSNKKTPVVTQISESFQHKDLSDEDDFVLISKKGKKTIIEKTISPLKDSNGSVDGYVIVLQDVTEIKDGIRVLQKISKELERRVEYRTHELQKSNSLLQNQISERKKAEEKAKETKSSIENIINSTTEIIFSINKGNKIEYWNASAEKLTGYKKKDVFGKPLGKLPFIDDNKRFIQLIKNVTEEKRSSSDKQTIITKDYSKKIVHISCSPIIIDDTINGFVFLGNDITYDWQRHHNLIPGHSYLIPEKTKKSCIRIFSNFLLTDYQGLYITRSHPHQIRSVLSMDDIRMIFVGKRTIHNVPYIESLDHFKDEITQFLTSTEKGIILIDGLHYFITRFSFDHVLETLFELNEHIYESSSILLLNLNPDILSSAHMALLQTEFESMPSSKVEDIKINDELSEILLFIKGESEKNSLVSLKKIISRFDIVYYTASKRVKQLTDEGLVFTKKYGKSRVVHLTEKAKTLLEKRESL